MPKLAFSLSSSSSSSNCATFAWQIGEDDAEILQIHGVQVEEFVLSVPDVNHHGARSEARTEFFNHRSDKRILSAGRERHTFTVWQMDWNSGKRSLPLDLSTNPRPRTEIRGQVRLPRACSEAPDQRERGRFNLLASGERQVVADLVDDMLTGAPA